MIGWFFKAGRAALGWATSGSLWPVAIAAGLGLSAGVALTAWGASYILDGAEKAEAAAVERAGFLGELLATRTIEIADRDTRINALSADIEALTAAASASHAEAMKLTRAAEGRVRALEARLSDAHKEQANVGPSNPLDPVSRGILVWLQCFQRAGEDTAAAARCADEARLSAD